MHGTSLNDVCHNPMYHPYSRISSALIPLVINEVSNRELQWI